MRFALDFISMSNFEALLNALHKKMTEMKKKDDIDRW